MDRLLGDYPPEPYAAAADLCPGPAGLCQGPEAAGDAKLRQQKINRVDLVRRAWTMLEGFLTAYPDDPAADQAAFSAANALLELKDYREAAAACNRYAARYPKSDLLDSYWYMIGYCRLRHRPAPGGPGDVPQGGRAQAARQGHRPRGGEPQQVAGDLHPRPDLPQPGRGRRRHPRVPPRRGPLQPTPRRRSNTSSARPSTCRK